ncbi:thermonuclease family protein [Marivita sp. S6314]|uniref:thermonuclease family protein n=1 Tax=Marivita sp. S6314 TaxID=2926406 RepID=UPI001FF42E4B|nr:thermonuclease family protein [Marivita sp. S6314]MCK0151053.1 thermonuclease family protein [Marivita sp. S6314]
MLRLATLLCVTLALPVSAGPSGPVHVIDGDTIDVGDTRVRLHAIDAPEADQMCGSADSPAWECGAWVTSEARRLFEGKRARCIVQDIDRYGRTVAICDVKGRDMGEVLVSEGLAFAYRRYGMAYDLTEKRAAVNARGLHGAGATSPAAFRASKRATRQAVKVRSGTGAKTVTVPKSSNRSSWLPKALDPSCAIKGNISRNGGTRIYHVPGQDYYDATRIDPSKGERWFCSESEARAAGWRKARK